jgi:hypothetical protein
MPLQLQVPLETLNEAQAFRIQRAKDVGERYNDPLTRVRA